MGRAVSAKPGPVGWAATSAARRGELFSRHVLPEMDVLLRVAGSLVSRPADAEDLVQDTLLRAYRAIDRFDGRHPRAWLLTIMRNAHVNRSRRRRPDLLDDQDATFIRLADQGASDAAPDGGVLGSVFDAGVAAALMSLPERFRQVVVLVDIDGLSYPEAADALGVPVGTVTSRLHRGRARIRKTLATRSAGRQGGSG